MATPYKFGSSPSMRRIRSITGKNKANDPRYRHLGRVSLDVAARRLRAKIEKEKAMKQRKGKRK